MKPPPGTDPDSIVLSFPVAKEFEGQRLDRFVQNRIPRLSRTKAQAIVKKCAYHADGRLRRPSDRVRFGEVVLLVRERFEEPDTPRYFDILHLDDDVLAVGKPAGLPMHPSASYHKNTLTYMLRDHFGDQAPHIAHRLDRETSGVVLCGVHLDAERYLKRGFEDRKVEKSYLAIVQGQPPEDGQMAVGIRSKPEGLHLLMEASDAPDALSARTNFHTLLRTGDHALVRLHPETGRQHQLRVHLASIGHPIVADKLYGPEAEQPFFDYIDSGMSDGLLERLGHERQALHAESITFDHPKGRVSGRQPKRKEPREREVMRIACELPEDLLQLWGSVGGDVASARAVTMNTVRAEAIRRVSFEK